MPKRCHRYIPDELSYFDDENFEVPVFHFGLILPQLAIQYNSQLKRFSNYHFLIDVFFFCRVSYLFWAISPY